MFDLTFCIDFLVVFSCLFWGFFQRSGKFNNMQVMRLNVEKIKSCCQSWINILWHFRDILKSELGIILFLHIAQYTYWCVVTFCNYLLIWETTLQQPHLEDHRGHINNNKSLYFKLFVIHLSGALGNKKKVINKSYFKISLPADI